MRELEEKKQVIRQRISDLQDHFSDLADEANLIVGTENERIEIIYKKKCKIHDKIKKLKSELDSLIAETN